MKITKRQLRRIIKEEKATLLDAGGAARGLQAGLRRLIAGEDFLLDAYSRLQQEDQVKQTHGAYLVMLDETLDELRTVIENISVVRKGVE
jgi:hypothetical protein